MTNKLHTTKELREERLASDPTFRDEWESTALARAVARALIAFRIEHSWSQTRLAQELGMRQPQVARLEMGDYNPRWETLHHIFSVLKLPFTYEYNPPKTNPTNKSQAQAREVITTSTGERLVVAVG